MQRKFRQYLLFPLLGILLIHCKQKEPAKAAITGQLKNAANKKIYFGRTTSTGDLPMDSASADESGKFSLPNHADKPDYYLLRTDDHNIAYLVLKGGEQLTVTGDATDLARTYDVEGSEDTRFMLQMKRFERHVSDSINKLYVAFRDESPATKDSMGMALQHRYDSLMRNFALEEIPKNLNSIVSISASLYLDKEKDLALFEKLKSSLAGLYPGNVYVESFEKQVEEMKKLPVGSMAPEIRLPGPDGTEKSLSSFKDKLVLIDFWASWCGPCRKEMPRMVQLYRSFKNRGFEILGVSLDESKASWTQAIAQYRITWPQGCDLKKWSSPAVIAYGVEELPYTILVDRQGKIAAKGLHGSELELKIQELLMIP